MSLRFSARLCTLSLALATVCAGSARAAEPAATGADASGQKFIFVPAMVAAFAGTGVFEALRSWTSSHNPPAPPVQIVTNGVPIQLSSMPGSGVPAAMYATQAPQALWVPAQPNGGAVNTTATGTYSPYYSNTPIILGKPDVPLTAANGTWDTEGTGGTAMQWANSANYQGVQISVAVLNQYNQPVEVRPLSAQFHTGERFRLHLTSTFDALASVDAYRPGGAANHDYVLAGTSWAGQIYPARADQVVSLRAATPVDLPLGTNEYFVFDQNASVEQLVLNVRHPQVQPGQNTANNQPVYRQDNAQGSYYVQLTAAGQYPAFSQLISLQHSR